MTGVRRPARRNSRHTSKPSLWGSMTSRMIRSNDCSRARRLAASPSRTTSTSYPSSFRSSSSAEAIGGSSSTTRMRAISLLRARQENRKRAADAGLTLDEHLAAMRGNDVLNHGQAQTCTLGSGNLCVRGPEEFLEDLLALMCGNPHSFVTHADCDRSEERRVGKE